MGVCLVKPQFEAGRDKVGKGGIVREKDIHEEVISDTLTAFEEEGFHCWDLTFSPIKGGSGNIEFLAYLKWKKPQEAISEERIRQVVEEAHETLKK